MCGLGTKFLPSMLLICNHFYLLEILKIYLNLTRSVIIYYYDPIRAACVMFGRTDLKFNALGQNHWTVI